MVLFTLFKRSEEKKDFLRTQERGHLQLMAASPELSPVPL